MAWVKLDDEMPRHPKVLDLSDRAFRVYITCLCTTSEFLKDGYITAAQMKQAKASPKVVRELLEAGLIHVDGVGYRIHDYLKYNPSREQVEKRRTDSAKRLRDWREAQKEAV